MTRYLVLLFTCSAFATGQTAEPHWVELNWSHPTATASYRIYRAIGNCSGVPPYAFLGQPTPIVAKTYNDKPVAPGRYAYAVTAVVASQESALSNCAEAVVPPKAPTSIQAMSPSAGIVNVTWTDAINPTGTTRSVYRTDGPCSGFPGFTRIAQGLTTNSYTDTIATQGSKCYGVTATFNGIESRQSDTSEVTLTGNSPAGASALIK